MSPELRQALLAVAGKMLEEFASSAEGKKLIAQAEEALLANLPGWEGVLYRAAAAILPHDVQSIGFKKDGPG